MKLVLSAVIVGSLLCSSGQALSQVSADAARRSAIKILLGEPYGKTPAAVSSVIVGQKLAPDVHCSSNKMVWEFLVVVPGSKRHPDGITGYLVLDQRFAKLICAALPDLG